MSEQKIILINDSRLLREILKRVIDKADGLRVVMELQHLKELEPAMRAIQPDWVLISVPDADHTPKTLEKIIQKYPGLKMIAVSADGAQVRMKWVEYHEEALDGLSWNDLTAILKQNKVTVEDD